MLKETVGKGEVDKGDVKGVMDSGNFGPWMLVKRTPWRRSVAARRNLVKGNQKGNKAGVTYSSKEELRGLRDEGKTRGKSGKYNSNTYHTRESREWSLVIVERNKDATSSNAKVDGNNLKGKESSGGVQVGLKPSRLGVKKPSK